MDPWIRSVYWRCLVVGNEGMVFWHWYGRQCCATPQQPASHSLEGWWSRDDKIGELNHSGWDWRSGSLPYP